jgi:hypothetical protein
MLLVAAAPAEAQFGPSPRAAGVSGAFSALARGYEAADWNPANLALPDNPTVSVGLARLHFAGTIFGPNARDVIDILNKGSDLTDADRAEFLATVPESGFEVRADGQIPWAAVSIGPLALSVTTVGHVAASVGKELIDMALYARQYGDLDDDRLEEYRVGNTSFRDVVYTKFAASYGMELNPWLPALPFPVTIGVTGRYVRGHDLQRGRLFEPRVSLTGDEIYITGASIQSPGGSGYSLDLGVAARPLPSLTVGLAVENILQKMDWDEDLTVRGGEFAGSEFSDLSAMDIYDRLQPRPFDPDTEPGETIALVEDLLTQVHFPRIVRIGAGLNLGLTRVGATLKTTQGKGELTTGWPNYLAAGVEQTLPFLMAVTLRAGLASSLDGASALSAGTTIGLGPLGLALAVSKLSGNENAVDDSFDSQRFAERIAAGSGYAFSVGLTLGLH